MNYYLSISVNNTYILVENVMCSTHERTVKINFFQNWGGARLQIFKKLRGPVCKFLKNWGARAPPGPYGRYAYGSTYILVENVMCSRLLCVAFCRLRKSDPTDVASGAVAASAIARREAPQVDASGCGGGGWTREKRWSRSSSRRSVGCLAGRSSRHSHTV